MTYGGLKKWSGSTSPSAGASGGVCVICDREKVEVIDRLVGSFTISIMCKFLGDDISKLVSRVYCPSYSSRREDMYFWEELDSVH